jgi:hypothetical protein
MTDTTERRTKRRYANDLYPHPEEDEIRDLSIEVPYLLSHAWGLRITDTGWTEVQPPARAGDRVAWHLEAARSAFLADALAQGLSGQEAWEWAAVRVTGDSVGEWLYERARHYAVPVSSIKPYPCGPEPTNHYHYAHGDHGPTTRIPLRESECADCTEPIEPPTEVPA